MKPHIASLLLALSFSTCSADSAPAQKKGATCMWIGCSHAKEPAGKALGFESDQLCMHSNPGNICNANDPSALAALRQAVENEQVTNIVVCGMYDCPAVRQAIQNKDATGDGLEPIRLVYQKNKATLDAINDETLRVNRLAELHVIEQVELIRQSPIVKAAPQKITIRGIVQDMQNQKSAEMICVNMANG